MEPIKDPKFDVDKKISEIIDYTELFLLDVKEVVKSILILVFIHLVETIWKLL